MAEAERLAQTLRDDKLGAFARWVIENSLAELNGVNEKESTMQPYLTTSSYAAARGISPGRVRQLLMDRRIPGAIRAGDSHRGFWRIPADAEPLAVGETAPPPAPSLTRDELLGMLLELAPGPDGFDGEEDAHRAADEVLLAYIGDPEILAAFDAIPKFYA